LDTLRDAINSKDFVITAELPLWPPRPRAALEADLRSLAQVADAVHLGLDDRADSGVAPLAAASIAISVGVDPILHLHGRDKNRIALQSEIIGAITVGVSTLVMRRGDKLPSMLRGRVKGVLDTKTTQLLSIAKRVAEREEFSKSSELLVGCLVPPMRPNEEWEAALIQEKLDCGAQLLQTRPIFNPDLLRDYAAALVAQKITHRARLLAGFPLLGSLSSARSMDERYAGTTVPEPMIRRLSEAGEARAEGIAVLAEQLAAAAETPGVSGAAIVNVDDVGAVTEAVKLAGLAN
jgi:methylenetetrahydrofolate reductase (NADPH)